MRIDTKDVPTISLREHYVWVDVDETMIITPQFGRPETLNKNIPEALQSLLPGCKIALFTNMDTVAAQTYYYQKKEHIESITREDVRDCFHFDKKEEKVIVVTPADPGQENGPGGAYKLCIEPLYKKADELLKSGKDEDEKFRMEAINCKKQFSQLENKVTLKTFQQSYGGTLSLIVKSIAGLDKTDIPKIEEIVQGFVLQIVTQLSTIEKEYYEIHASRKEHKSHEEQLKLVLIWKLNQIFKNNGFEIIGEKTINNCVDLIITFLNYLKKYLSQKGYMAEYCINAIRSNALSLLFFDDRAPFRDAVERANGGTINGLIPLSTLTVNKRGDSLDYYKNQITEHLCLVTLKEYRELFARIQRDEQEKSKRQGLTPILKILDSYLTTTEPMDFLTFQGIIRQLNEFQSAHPLLPHLNRLLGGGEIKPNHLGYFIKLISLTNQLMKTPTPANQKKYLKLSDEILGLDAYRGPIIFHDIGSVTDFAIAAVNIAKTLPFKEQVQSSATTFRAGPPPIKFSSTDVPEVESHVGLSPQ